MLKSKCPLRSCGCPALLLARHPTCRRRLRLPCRATAEPECLGMASSQYNSSIMVLQMPHSAAVPPTLQGARVLLLGQPGDVHSMWHPDTAVTGCYWDPLALLPALVPEGPISILGLGAGTVVHLLHQLAPSRVLHGWELDPVVLLMAEMHMGLEPLKQQGCLVTHVGDALSPEAVVEGGSAGIIVDLFSEGAVLQQLTQEETWQCIRNRLRSGGRVFANLGAWSRPGDTLAPVQQTMTLPALRAMHDAFGGKVSVAPCFLGGSSNLLAITGPAISSEQWAAIVPEELMACRQLHWQPAAAVLQQT